MVSPLRKKDREIKRTNWKPFSILQVLIAKIVN